MVFVFNLKFDYIFIYILPFDNLQFTDNTAYIWRALIIQMFCEMLTGNINHLGDVCNNQHADVYMDSF